MSTERQFESAGPLLALLMRRHGWSAARLAEIAGGVSASSVRAYTADRSKPRPGQALAVANALGPQEGHQMLEAWGYHDLAEGFTDEWQRAGAAYETRPLSAAEGAGRGNRIDYGGESLSASGLGVVRAMLEWVQSVETSLRNRS